MAPHSLVQGTGSGRTVLCIRTSVLLAILYTCGFFVVASSQFRQHGFPLDDSYIYQTIARGLAHGTPGFVPGQHAGGATSFLWVYLQATNYTVFHGFDPVVYNLVLSWLLLLLIGQLLFAIARQDGLSPRSCWIIAASPAVCGNFLWLGMIGMEHLLFVALSLAAIYFWFLRTTEISKYSSVCAGISLGLLAATRPEAIVFGPVLILVSARKAGRTLGDTTRALLLWLTGTAIYFAWSLRNFHSLMPSTFKGRSWLWFQTYGGPHSAKAITGFFRHWLQQLPRQFSARFVETQMRLTPGNRLFTALVLLILIFIAIGLYGLLSQKPPRMKFVLLLAGMHAALYLTLLPATGHGCRYQPLFLLLLFPLLFLGIDGMVKAILRAERPATFAIALFIAVAGSASLYAWRSVTIMGTELINETHGQMAAWIQQHLPPQTKLAAFDSGRISYDLSYPITDMGGLADKTFLPYLTTGHVSQYLELHGVQYFVIPELEGQSLPLFSASMPQTVSIAKFCASPALFKNGYAYTSHAWRCQHLYQLLQP